ncbi:MAG: hypothetical protein AAB114_05375, partial [Chloroflexota bacterium]
MTLPRVAGLALGGHPHPPITFGQAASYETRLPSTSPGLARIRCRLAGAWRRDPAPAPVTGNETDRGRRR